jgi:hypothetical protein
MHKWFSLICLSTTKSIPYSEGPGLSKSDEKAYWGKIEECAVDRSGSGLELEELENKKRIEIKGTIFWGWGLEPGKLF